MDRFKNRVVFEKRLLPINVGNLCEIIGNGYQLENVAPDALITCIACETGYEPLSEGFLLIERFSDETMVCRIKSGGTAVLTDHKIEGIPCIVVDNVISAVYNICKWMYEAISIPAVIVSGGTGKTTTKRMINSFLEKQKNVFSTNKNSNILVEFCCHLQSVRTADQITIWEVCENWRRDAESFSILLKPEIVVVTNIGDSHLGAIGSKEEQYKCFRALTSGIDKDSIVIINADDEECMQVGFDGNTISIGINNTSADCVSYNITNTRRGTEFDLRYLNDSVHVKLSVFGIHNVYNAMMAYVVGVLQGVEKKAILKGLKKYHNVGIRQNIIRFGGVVVYADCYNASAKSIASAIKCFCEIPGVHGKRVAVIGDIAEIEGYEEKTYREIAQTIDNSTIDVLLTYGKDSSMIHDYIRRKIEKKHFTSIDDLNNCLKQMKTERGNGYLFKASRSIRLERSFRAVFPTHYYSMRAREKYLYRSRLWR